MVPDRAVMPYLTMAIRIERLRLGTLPSAIGATKIALTWVLLLGNEVRVLGVSRRVASEIIGARRVVDAVTPTYPPLPIPGAASEVVLEVLQTLVAGAIQGAWTARGRDSSNVVIGLCEVFSRRADS